MQIGNGTLIGGFEEGLKLFGKGEKGSIKIPPALAYGDSPTANIPANATLICEIAINPE